MPNKILAIAVLFAISLTSSLSAELVLSLSFDGNVVDGTGINTATLRNGADFTTNTPNGTGHALSLSNGMFENQGVRVDANEILAANPFTLSYWINPTAQQDGGYERITGRNSYTFETALGAEPDGTSTLKYYRGSGAWVTTETDIPMNEWTHVTWVNSGNNGPTDMELYINGVSEFVGAGLTSTRPGDNFLSIGTAYNDVEGFEGYIDELRLYDTVLNADEIMALAGVDTPKSLAIQITDFRGTYPPGGNIDPLGDIDTSMSVTCSSNMPIGLIATLCSERYSWLNDTSHPLYNTFLPTLTIHDRGQAVTNGDAPIPGGGIGFFDFANLVDGDLIDLTTVYGIDHTLNLDRDKFVIRGFNQEAPEVSVLSETFLGQSEEFRAESLGLLTLSEMQEMEMFSGYDFSRLEPTGSFYVFRGQVPVSELILSIYGDFDTSGQIDLADVKALSAEIQSGNNKSSFDLTNDSLVDTADLKQWIEIAKNSWFGDANLDGEFNSADLVQVLSAGKYEDANALASWEDGDWNADGRFDSSDLVIALSGGGYELGARREIVAVPESNSRWIPLLCLMLAGASRRKVEISGT